LHSREAINGEEALAELNVRGVTVDLVLSDVVMPVMNGRALSDHVARSHPALPVLLMSAYSAEVLGNDGLLDASRPFLAKPLALDALLSVVGACLPCGRRARRRCRRGDGANQGES
jgi:DNA-binding NtrC family response regulator